jgi:hypothetical protein
MVVLARPFPFRSGRTPFEHFPYGRSRVLTVSTFKARVMLTLTTSKARETL